MISFANSKKIEILLLVIILLGGFIVRLYRFNGPIADWHAWRQADTSAVSRNLVNGGFNLLYPKFDDLSNVPSGFDNPNGYRYVEFPFYNVLQAGGFVLFDHFTLEEWGRLITIMSTLFATIFIFLLTKKYAGKLPAFFAAFFYTFFPFLIYYGRTILPDETMVAVTLCAIYLLSIGADSKTRSKQIVFWILATVFFAISLLFKPFAVFFFLPAVWILWKKYAFKFLLKPWLWFMLIASFVPFAIWRIWISAHPEGIPQSAWLFNGGNIRFTGAFFIWIFARRIGSLILGYWGIPILILGILTRQKNKLFFLCFLVSSLIYLFVVARGNVQHGYYQLPILPTMAMLLGLGSVFFLSPPKEQVSKFISYPVFIICCLFMLAFSWYQARDFFNINNQSIVIAGQAVDKLVPKNARVIAPLDGDTSFLYETKRKGWASFEKPLEQLIKMGADYLVLVNPKPKDFNIGKTYKIVSNTKDYILFDLHNHP